MSRRTDPHRPGVIAPQQYRYFVAYAGGAPGCPPWNVDIAWARVADHGRDLIRHAGSDEEQHNSLFQCDICGTWFREGALFLYEPTGKVVTVGKDCAQKYELLADDAEWLGFQAHLRINARTIKEAADAKRRESFLKRHPGLEEALKVQHRITQDMAARFQKKCRLSEKQVALAFKLQAGSQRPAEAKVPAPEGRLTVQGQVISMKVRESAYGRVWKMTVKVITDSGVWLAWGTCPESLITNGQRYLDGSEPLALKGTLVEFTANFERGNEAHFALFNRPTAARRIGA